MEKSFSPLSSLCAMGLMKFGPLNCSSCILKYVHISHSVLNAKCARAVKSQEFGMYQKWS